MQCRCCNERVTNFSYGLLNNTDFNLFPNLYGGPKRGEIYWKFRAFDVRLYFHINYVDIFIWIGNVREFRSLKISHIVIFLRLDGLT